MKAETRHVKYAFADVVDFSVDRTVEAQVEIIAALNAAFKEAARSLEVIFLPTGDGICAGIIEPNTTADAHIQLALHVLYHIHKWSEGSPLNRRCTVRFGINESVDSIVTDINGQRNLAGAGINQTQRLMNIADGNQIVVGRAAFETLHVHDDYAEAFREIRTEVKHGQVVTAYQFVRDGLPSLNTKVPHVVQRMDPIDLNMTTALSDHKNFSTSGQIHCVHEATEEWNSRMESVLAEIIRNCTQEQAMQLRKTQAAWENYRSQEMTWLGELRSTVHGSMYRVFAADIDLQLVRRRAKALCGYRDEWLEARS